MAMVYMITNDQFLLLNWLEMAGGCGKDLPAMIKTAPLDPLHQVAT